MSRNGFGYVSYAIIVTAGQERYHALAPMYYRGAHAALIVYDITSRVRMVIWFRSESYL